MEITYLDQTTVVPSESRHVINHEGTIGYFFGGWIDNTLCNTLFSLYFKKGKVEIVSQGKLTVPSVHFARKCRNSQNKTRYDYVGK